MNKMHKVCTTDDWIHGCDHETLNIVAINCHVRIDYCDNCHINIISYDADIQLCYIKSSTINISGHSKSVDTFSMCYDNITCSDCDYFESAAEMTRFKLSNINDLYIDNASKCNILIDNSYINGHNRQHVLYTRCCELVITNSIIVKLLIRSCMFSSIDIKKSIIAQPIDHPIIKRATCEIKSDMTLHVSKLYKYDPDAYVIIMGNVHEYS